MTDADHSPELVEFDGTDLWLVHQFSATVMRIRPGDGKVLDTWTGNGISLPMTAAFDDERILVTNFAGPSVSLWKATDLTPLGSFPTGINNEPQGACSDGVNFWLTFPHTDKLGGL